MNEIQEELNKLAVKTAKIKLLMQDLDGEGLKLAEILLIRYEETRVKLEEML